MSNINKNGLRKIFSSKERLLALAGLGFLVALSLSHPLEAQSVAQGYNSDQSLQRGMLVSVKLDDPGKVEALKSDALERLRGVVIQPSDIPVTLSSEGQKLFVANSGTYEVLVSDQNGPIKSGDYISISSLEGIGMKADDTQRIILGQAVTGFEVGSDIIGSSVLEGANQKKVNFGKIEVNIAINKNPIFKAPDAPKIPGILDKISQTIANKPVSPPKVYLATAIFTVASVISGIMLYSGSRSSLISLGRNPLSRKDILRGLVQVVLLSLIVFMTGLFGVYLLLKL
jgi:hypothetical protein